mmetsp:Transcript_7700/g.7910  ORF Transcript_7700/g.7910 Transcript_7700/m.7910 type:complete len:87 (-) Transcript_7700:40-300(-)
MSWPNLETTLPTLSSTLSRRAGVTSMSLPIISSGVSDLTIAKGADLFGSLAGNALKDKLEVKSVRAKQKLRERETHIMFILFVQLL